MKSRVVKFDKLFIFSFIENSSGGFMLSDYESTDKNLKDGRVTLSLKYNKRRKLIKGKVTIELEYSCLFAGVHESYYFTPNNRTKFLSVFQTS